jgi:hypothetical protein
LRLSLLPIKPRPERPTAKILEIEAKNNNPPLPDRELAPQEFWNIRKADAIIDQNNIRDSAAAEFQALGCPSATDFDILVCQHDQIVVQTVDENLRRLIRDIRYPDNIEDSLLPIPPRPTDAERQQFAFEQEQIRIAAAEETERRLAMAEMERDERTVRDALGNCPNAKINELNVKQFGSSAEINSAINARRSECANFNTLWFAFRDKWGRNPVVATSTTDIIQTRSGETLPYAN